MTRFLAFRFVLLVGAFCLSPSAHSADAPAVIRISVPGIVCEGCAESITTALKNLEGVSEAYVDPDAKVALVEAKPSSPVSDAAIRTAVKGAGYEAKRIEREQTPWAEAKAALQKKAS